MKKISIIIIVIFASVLIWLLARDTKLNTFIEQEKQRGTELSKHLHQVELQNDSLLKMNQHLYSQKQLTEAMLFLTEAMLFRDSVMTSEIRPGHLIKLLDTGDSAVVTEFIIGGNQYNYWIKYKVAGKFGERDVSPILICSY